MNKVLVFTVIYPQADIYINEFLECLKSQTFRDFDLLIVNDGCDDISLSLKFGEFNLKIIDSCLSPAKNRELGIRYAFENNYQKLIFCDIDDWFHPTRFETSLAYLHEADIVVNNLNIVGEDRKLLCANYYSYSINESTNIDLDFLDNKNILGLSNTAINVQEKAVMEFPEKLSIVDWYYFANCVERGLTISYCDIALTDYRQHGNNLIGIDDFSVPLYRKMISLKTEHYEYMSKIYSRYYSLLEKVKILKELSDDQLVSLIDKNKKRNPHPLWWENIKE